MRHVTFAAVYATFLLLLLGCGSSDSTPPPPAPPLPTVTSVAPPTGPTAGGTAVTITGTNFVAPATVTIGGSAAVSVVVVDATTITCVTPAGPAGPAAVAVTTPNGMGTLAGGFTYRANTRQVFIRHAGAENEVSVALTSDTLVQPGDTIRIPERRF